MPAEREASVEEELRRQEELLARGAPAVRVAVVVGPAVSYGVGVREGAPYLERATALGLPTPRRGGGGTGLLHLPGDLLWCVVLPRHDPRVGGGFARAYARLGRGIVQALEGTGVSVAWAPAAGPSPEYCTLSSRGEVLAHGERIVGGAAQHVTARALLHHGAVSYRVDRSLLAQIFDLPLDGAVARLAGVADLGTLEPPLALAERARAALAADLAL